METICLKGKSQKGKNRIREHGAEWKVLNRLDRLNDEPGPWALIESARGGIFPHCRWVNLRSDNDFEVIPAVQ